MNVIKYPNASDPILCWVDRDDYGNRYASFTPAAIEDQWGDDWNDAPYEHNAGTPYDEHGLTKVFFVAPLVDPKYAQFNSPWSVEGINIRREVAWLRPREDDQRTTVRIWGGTPLSEFKRLILEADGDVLSELSAST